MDKHRLEWKFISKFTLDKVDKSYCHIIQIKLSEVHICWVI